MSVVGQFRDSAQPDHFVWFRGFADHAVRNAALSRFYGGPVWAEHGPAANSTMIDSDDVLMLMPAGAALAFADLAERLAGPPPEGLDPIVVATHHFPAAPSTEVLRPEAARIVEAAQTAGAMIFASLISDRSPNGFPRLPVRAEANVVVTVARSPLGKRSAVCAALAGSGAASSSVAIAELLPTDRSRLR